jgi:integrase
VAGRVGVPTRGAALPVGGRRLLAGDRLAELAQRVYRPTAQAVGVDSARPYDLRHAFASLLIHEGRMSVVEIAAQLGHNPTVCLDTYAHVMAEQAGGERVGAVAQIEQAREAVADDHSQGAQLPLGGLG